jgi:FKBP-type peptidyl-prolyl cis-trans isomerase
MRKVLAQRALVVLLVASAITACASAPAGPFADPQAIAYAPTLGVDLAAATRLRSGIYVQDVQDAASSTRADGPAANSRSNVRLHYTLYLPDGSELQTTRGAAPLEVRLDDPEFLIREGVVGMRPGGRRLLVVPPARGYGRAGVPGLVPPNSTLVFEVELLEVR